MTRRRKSTLKTQSHWKSRSTFILAASGAAVGLANIWKFPTLVGEHGGGAFVLVYLLCVALVGVPIMIAEVCLGRRGRKNPIDSMKKLSLEAGESPLWTSIGWLGIIAGLLVLSYYSVIAGWAIEYIFTTNSNRLLNLSPDTANAIFETFVADRSRLIQWQSVFLLITTAVVARGTGKGIATAVRIMIPLLFVLMLVLVVLSMAQGNTATAMSFLFGWDVEKLSWSGVLVAIGHAFLSLGLGAGAIMTYGAYMPDRVAIGETVFAVALMDTAFALIIGLVIFPMVFATDTVYPTEGPELMFVTLPVVFGNMAGGQLFGTLFFIVVIIAAWTSTISLMEPAVAWLTESKRYSRLNAALLVAGTAWLLGLGTVFSFNDWADFTPFLGMTFFEFLDFLTTNIMLPVTGILIAVFVGWGMRSDIVRHMLREDRALLYHRWLFILRYISPVAVFLVLLTTLYYKFRG